MVTAGRYEQGDRGEMSLVETIEIPDGEHAPITLQAGIWLFAWKHGMDYVTLDRASTITSSNLAVGKATFTQSYRVDGRVNANIGGRHFWADLEDPYDVTDEDVRHAEQLLTGQ